MCFGGPKEPPPPTPPAPAPPPPDPVAETADITAGRRAEDKENFGSSAPSLRVNRSTTSGGVGAQGTGIRI